MVGVGKEEVDFSNFGVHYSLEESVAQQFGMNRSRMMMTDEVHLYEVEVDMDDINWPLTVALFMRGEYSCDENEIVLNTNVDIRITKCGDEPININANTGYSFDRANDETLPPEASEDEVREMKDDIIDWIQIYQ